MNYIYAPSYQSIFFALYLKDIEYKELIVITRSKNIQKLMKRLRIECKFLGDLPLGIRTLKNLRLLKKETESFLDNINQNDSLYFCYTGFDVSGFYLIKEWAKKNGEVYFKNFDPKLNFYRMSYKDLYKINSYKAVIFKIIYKYVLNLKYLCFYEISNRPVLGISKKFNDYLKVNKTFSLSMYEIKKSVIKNYTINDEKVDVLIVTEGLVHNRSIEIKEESLCKIYDSLLENETLTLRLKLHPNDKDNDYFNRFPQYSQEIPSEFLFGNTIIVIGVYSASLISALIMENVIVVSLLEMINWQSEEQKDFCRQFLLDEMASLGANKNKIVFPKTLDDLDRIFIKVLNNYESIIS